jgi:tetratricopeptide (TPR) repeat protein
VRLGRALAHKRLGQTDAAEAVAQRGLSDPTLRDVFVGLATTRLSARDTIAPQRLERYADFAQRYDNARLAVALGWQHYDNHRYDVSARWFANALDWEATPKAFEGLVLALSAAGRREDARDVHRRWREQFPDVAERLEIGRAESPLAEAQRTGDYRTCLETARRLRARGEYEPGDAVLHGWCLMDLKRHAEAELRFEAAITDLKRSRPKNEPLLGGALVGRATAQIAQGRIADALRGLDRQALSSQQIARLRAQALAEYAYTAMERQRYAEVLRVLEIRERYATPTRGLRVIEGWAYYNTGRSERAARIFEELNVQFSTEDTRDALELVRKYTQ